MSLTLYFVKLFAALFAVLNPIGAVPIFVSLTQDRGIDEVRRIPRRTAMAVCVILIVAAFFGQRILGFFGVGIPAFRIAGGILILLISIAMVRARQPRAKYTPKEATESADKEDITVVPLAVPLMAGPGAISLVIVDARHASNYGDKFLLSVGLSLIHI